MKSRLKGAIAEIRGVNALILQSETLTKSVDLLLAESTDITVAIVALGDNMYFSVYEKSKGINDHIFIQKVDPQCVEFVKYVKRGGLWVLCLQVLILEESETGEWSPKPYSFITMNTTKQNALLSDPVSKDGWITVL